MGYEFKDEILVDIGPEPNCNYESEVENYYSKIRELEKVYAKAKAFDELYSQVKRVEKELFGTGKPIVPQKDAFAILGNAVSDFIYDEYESGGYDEL